MSTITWKYVKPLMNQGAVDKFGKDHGVVFPEDLRQILIKNNGGRPSLKYFDLPSEKDKEFKTLLSFNEGDIETIYKCYPLDSTDKSLVPFASDPAGNYLVLKEGKIYFWLHETDVAQFVSETFTAFLNGLHE